MKEGWDNPGTMKSEQGTDVQQTFKKRADLTSLYSPGCDLAHNRAESKVQIQTYLIARAQNLNLPTVWGALIQGSDMTP